MFNQPLFHEESKLKVEQREREAETYRLQKQLGFNDRGTARWIFILMTLLAAVLILIF